MQYALKPLNAIVYWGYKIAKHVGAACLTTIFLSITVGIVSRYVFNSPVTWSEEVCTFMMVHVCFISAATTTAQKKHIVADFFIAKAPHLFRGIMKYVTYLLEAFFFIALIVSIINILPSLVWKSPVLSIPRQYYYSTALIGGIYMVICIVTQVLNEFFPGYDLMDEQRKKEADDAQASEAAEAAEIQKQMDSFMKSAGYEVDPSGKDDLDG